MYACMHVCISPCLYVSTQNWSTNVTQFKIDPQMSLKIYPQLLPKSDPQTLLKIDPQVLL